MKAVWCAIWILGALLIIATLDNLPDPAAATPSSGQLQLSGSHGSSGGAIRFCESRPPFFQAKLRALDSDVPEPPPFSGRTVSTEQAADPSPPQRISV
jgi:hypothetical protein